MRSEAIYRYTYSNYDMTFTPFAVSGNCLPRTRCLAAVSVPKFTTTLILNTNMKSQTCMRNVIGIVHTQIFNGAVGTASYNCDST